MCQSLWSVYIGTLVFIYSVYVHSTKSSWTLGYKRCEDELIMTNHLGMVDTPDLDDASESISLYNTF